MPGISDLATAKDVPYLLATVFALAGWTATHIVDRVVQSPTVQYSAAVRLDGESRSRIKTVRVCNVTRDRLFSKLHFTLRASSPTAIRTASIRAVGAAYPIDEPKRSSRTASFHIRSLHPGMCVELLTTYDGDKPPSFHLQDSAEAVRLVENGLETFFTSNEMTILIIMLAGYIAVVAAWATKYTPAR